MFIIFIMSNDRMVIAGVFASVSLFENQNFKLMAATVVPNGLQALFLTTQTCEILGLRAGVDVTADLPFKKIPRAALLDDIKARRAISDFQPYRDVIGKYPEDTMVVVYDVEWKYGQNFYFCLTPAAAQDITNVTEFVTIRRAYN